MFTIFLQSASPTNSAPVLLFALILAVIFIFIIWVRSMTKKGAEINQRRADEARRRRADEEARRANEAQHRARQESYLRQMFALGEQSVKTFEELPKQLNLAESHLDQAEVEFRDSVFAPFWDQIERAAIALGYFNNGVQTIKENSLQYAKLTKEYADVHPGFPLAPQSVAKLGIGLTTANRMKSIVRKAQSNFQFATIYEQRKTNQILVAGFTNLAQALEYMTERISGSIGDLANSVDAMALTLRDSTRSIHSQIGNLVQTNIHHQEQWMRESSDRAQREKDALRMLDNIQRGRKPFL
jgi:hypothetical protein